ncbi:MAG TPA: hypothetical protein VL727_09190 [Puia sp.]|jgi:hypothetical protein|nr:hypothetical protein [Puia sp.]
MKRAFLFFFVLLFAQQSFSQKIIEDYTSQQGSLRYGPGEKDLLPYGDKGFTLVLPDDGHALAGTVIDLEDSRLSAGDTLLYKEFRNESLKRGFAFLTIATGLPVDWYFSENSLKYVDVVMKDTFTRFHLPGKNIFFLGLMTSGHRALKYVEYCKKGKSVFNPAIRGVILSECAIDWVRMWYEGQKQVRDHETETSFFEGNLVHYLFDEHLKATPVTAIDKYIEFSPYSYFDLEMKKPMLYKDLSIRAYTYADIRYWFSALGKGVYDCNYPDMSGFINEQKLIGNKKAELVVFHSNMDDQLSQQKRRQSATWDLVDKKELVEWMVGQGD